MIVRIDGYEKEILVEEGKLNCLVIKNNLLYRSIIDILLNENYKENNEIVFIDGKVLSSKDIEYIEDLNSYKLDNKLIFSKIIKRCKDELNLDINLKNELNQHYLKLLSFFVSEFDLLEIDYDYKDEAEYESLYKTFGITFDFTNKTDYFERIRDIININIKLSIKTRFVINDCATLLTNTEILKLYKFVKDNGLTLLFIEHNDIDSDLFDCFVIDEDLGLYHKKRI